MLSLHLTNWLFPCSWIPTITLGGWGSGIEFHENATWGWVSWDFLVSRSLLWQLWKAGINEWMSEAQQHCALHFYRWGSSLYTLTSPTHVCAHIHMLTVLPLLVTTAEPALKRLRTDMHRRWERWLVHTWGPLGLIIWKYRRLQGHFLPFFKISQKIIELNTHTHTHTHTHSTSKTGEICKMGRLHHQYLGGNIILQTVNLRGKPRNRVLFLVWTYSHLIKNMN